MAEAAQQNQTLSLRISEALRKRLDEIRKLTAIRKGENVSTSEIAKQLLESAREERLEVAELLAEPPPHDGHADAGRRRRYTFHPACWGTRI